MDGFAKIKSKIKKALQKRGDYSDDMEFMIDTTAGIYLAYLIAKRDIQELYESGGKSYVIEKTREKNSKLNMHPSYDALLKTSESLRRNFRELKLTLSTVENTSGDEIDELINRVNDVECR